MKKLLGVFFAILLLPVCAQAVPITIAISGNVTSASGSGLPGTIHAGVSFTGTYTYDSNTPDSDTSPIWGVYQHNSPYGISIAIGGYEFKTASNHVGQFKIRITNDDPVNGPKDYYTVFSDENVVIPSAGLTIDYIKWGLSDSTYTAFSSDTLPVTAPVLTDWNYNVLDIHGFDSLGHGLYIYGTVTQAVIPEPLTVSLMMMGILFFKRRR